MRPMIPPLQTWSLVFLLPLILAFTLGTPLGILPLPQAEPTSVSSTSGGPPPEIAARYETLRQQSAALTQATYLLERRERKGGRALPYQAIEVSWRKPEDLHLRWTGGASVGQQVLWRQGWNNGKLKVDPGEWMPTLDIDPRGGAAMKTSRQPVWMASIARISSTLVKEYDRTRRRADLVQTFTDLGTVSVAGQISSCWTVDLPKDVDPSQYAYKVEICLSSQGLPTRVRAWDDDAGTRALVEDYTFSRMNTAPGLTDAAFDPAALGF